MQTNQQVNYVTKNAYTGINRIALLETQEEEGYKSNEWITFLQAKRIGRTIMKGEHGTPMIRMVSVLTEDEEDELRPRSFILFNIEQTIGD